MVFKISIRLRHQCPFLEFSTKFGKKTIFHYCSSLNDYIVIPEKLSEEKKNFAKIHFARFKNFHIQEFNNKSKLTYISMECPCNSSLESNICPKIRELNGVPIYPIVYRNGYEYYDIYLKDEFASENLISSLKNQIEFDVLYKKDIGDDWIESQSAVLSQLIENLTPLQIETLMEAFEGGYYDIPRGIRIDQISLKNDKTRYAIEKTLRSAENKILKYIMPFIYLQQAGLKKETDKEN